MKIHEYQGKEILKKYGVPVPRAIPAFSVAEAVEAAKALGGSVWVVKAQIHAGGRGKGGGVKVAKSMEELTQFATEILGMQLVTHQTGPAGQKVRRLLIEEGADIQKEYYLGMVVDRGTQKICVMASSEGGMDIEHVAEHTPELIHKAFIAPSEGLTDAVADDLARKMGIPEGSIGGARVAMQGLYKAFVETDADLAEINPLITTGDGRVVALDAKMNFDSNALYRHPEIVEMRDLDEEDPAEIEASKFDLAYISLDGNIGCLVNGAGLAMATMDTIKLYGGEPANFLDVGGGATAEKVTEAFKIMLKNPDLKAILVNIFGGIMRCDVIAEGVITAAKQVKLQVPLVVRMKGTNEDLGKKMLAESGLPIIAADTMAEAAEKVVAATGGTIPAHLMTDARSTLSLNEQAAGFNAVAAGVGAVAVGAVSALSSATEKSATMLGLTAGIAADGVSAVASGVGAVVTGVASTAVDVVGGVIGAVVDGTEVVVDKAADVGVAAYEAVLTGAEKIADGTAVEAVYDTVVEGAETVIGGVGSVVVGAATAVGDVAGAVVDTASETLNNVGEGVAAVGAGAVAAGAGVLGVSERKTDKAAGGVAGFLKRFWWVLPLLLIGAFLLKNCGGKGDAEQPAPVPVATEKAAAPAAASATSKMSLGTWALNLLSGGKYELNGKVSDQATKDGMLAAAKKAFGDANVVDKLAIDAAAAPVGFKGDWSKLFELFKANGARLTVNGDVVNVTGEVDDSTKGTLIGALKSVLGEGYKVEDHLMKKGATASEGASLLKVEFATGSDAIPAAAQAGLNAFAADLKKSGKKGEIGGHTDNVGDAAKNLALSEARAKAVVAYLVKQGVAADALTAKGYGDASPIADNANDNGRARNRRVEFK